jgi:hypothetical protein
MTTHTQRIPKQRGRLIVAAWLLFSGCGDDDQNSPRRRETELADAAAEGGDASADAAKPAGELESKLTDLFGELDRTTEQNCSCYVEMGAYSSVEECVMWQASRPEWAPCTASVLEEHPEGLAVLQCVVEELRKNAECLATKPCDGEARAECDLNPIECVGNEDGQTLALALATRCPDISLLPRQQ